MTKLLATTVCCLLFVSAAAAQRPPQPAAPAPATPLPPAAPAVPARPTQAAPAPVAPAPPATPASTTTPFERPAPRIDQPNVRFDIAIADEGGGAPAAKKNLTLLVQGGGRASLRSVARVPQGPNEPASGAGVQLNADAEVATWFPNEPNKIRARITVDYQPYVKGAALPGSVRAQVDVALESGRKLLIWQTADPLSDRHTTIEVTATLVK